MGALAPAVTCLIAQAGLGMGACSMPANSRLMQSWHPGRSPCYAGAVGPLACAPGRRHLAADGGILLHTLKLLTCSGCPAGAAGPLARSKSGCQDLEGVGAGRCVSGSRLSDRGGNALPPAPPQHLGLLWRMPYCRHGVLTLWREPDVALVLPGTLSRLCGC